MLKWKTRKRERINTRQLIQLAKQVEHDAAFLATFVVPTYTEPQIARAAFTAESIIDQIDKAEGLTQRMLVASVMYQTTLKMFQRSVEIARAGGPVSDKPAIAMQSQNSTRVDGGN